MWNLWKTDENIIAREDRGFLTRLTSARWRLWVIDENTRFSTPRLFKESTKFHGLKAPFSPIAGDEYDQDSCVPIHQIMSPKGRDDSERIEDIDRINNYIRTYVAPDNRTSIALASVKHAIVVTRIVDAITTVANRSGVLVSALRTTIGTSSSIMTTQANSKRVSFCRSGPGKIVIFGSLETSHWGWVHYKFVERRQKSKGSCNRLFCRVCISCAIFSHWTGSDEPRRSLWVSGWSSNLSSEIGTQSPLWICSTCCPPSSEDL